MRLWILMSGVALTCHAFSAYAPPAPPPALDPTLTGEGYWWREVIVKGPDKKRALLPPGPHMILTVPVSLRDVPTGIESYQIECQLTGPISDRDLQMFQTRLTRLTSDFGVGETTDALPAPTGGAAAAGTANTNSVDFEAKVPIFLAPIGEEIEIRDVSDLANPWHAVRTVDAPGVYQCRFYLFSKGWSGSVRYIDPDAPTQKALLPYQNGESAFPIAPNAPYHVVVSDRLPPPK